MSQIIILAIVKSAGKFFFDLAPEITEILALQAMAKFGSAYNELAPTIVEAYRCQKSRVIAYMHREESHPQFQLAA